jgi:hypothetical protein
MGDNADTVAAFHALVDFPIRWGQMPSLDISSHVLTADSTEDINAEKESSGQTEKKGYRQGNVNPLVKGFSCQNRCGLIGLVIHVF